MIRLDHRASMPGSLRGAVIALGNFDGFHLGHQAVVYEAVEWARSEGRPAIVATFDPHPVRHFAPHVPPFRLTSLDQRQELFASAPAAANSSCRWPRLVRRNGGTWGAKWRTGCGSKVATIAGRPSERAHSTAPHTTA
jgi:cytidyltransferase-like protein